MRLVDQTGGVAMGISDRNDELAQLNKRNEDQ